MPEYCVKCCDLCQMPMSVTNGWGRAIQKMKGEHGLTFEIGYSIGGWGHRSDWGKYTGLVCQDCFGKAEAAARLFVATIDGLRRERPGGDPFSSMRDEEPSPKGRKRALLR